MIKASIKKDAFQLIENLNENSSWDDQICWIKCAANQEGRFDARKNQSWTIICTNYTSNSNIIN